MVNNIFVRICERFKRESYVLPVCFAGGTAAWLKRRSKPSWGTEGSLRQWWLRSLVSGHALQTLRHDVSVQMAVKREALDPF